MFCRYTDEHERVDLDCLRKVDQGQLIAPFDKIVIYGGLRDAA